MIVFDLKCGGGHVFEAWFASSSAYATQADAGQIACPLCGNTAVEKALMAPAIPAKRGSSNSRPPALIKAALQAMAKQQNEALASSTWVGSAFANEARAMHAGERATATIHGQATLTEAKSMIEEGVPIAPLPFPVVPPKVLN